jgi:hypothetical protein
MTPQGRQRYGVVIGVLRVARGRADGIALFGHTAQAFLASLAPLLAFPLVGTVLGVFSDGVVASLSALAMYLCALLMPAAASYEMARWWGRGDLWLRFATAFNWCEWILPLLACLLVVPVSLAIGLGVSPKLASLMLLGSLAAYGLWLHWFLARYALALSPWRAVLMVIVVNAATAAAVTIPALIADLLA